MVNGSGVVLVLGDGQPHEIRFTNNRLIDVEENFGSFDAMRVALDIQPVKTARYLLWIATGKATTLEATGELMDGVGSREIVTALTTAFDKAFGVAASAAAADEPDPTPGPQGPTPSTIYVPSPSVTASPPTSPALSN